MAGKLNLYNLGKLGVNVDKSPVHLDDLELTKSQNAIHDPIGALDGALKNRPGLVKLNSVAGAGSIVGGVGVPYTRPVTRTLYVGHQTGNGVYDTSGWRTSTVAAFASGASTVSVPRNPANNTGISTISQDDYTSSNVLAGNRGLVVNNRLYYATNFYGVAADSPPINMFDGTLDTTIAVIPKEPTNDVFVRSVLSMVAAKGSLYIGTFDSGTDETDIRGRVFELNLTTGALSLLGAQFTAGLVPISLVWYLGRLWAGLHTSDVTVGGQVHFIRPGIDTGWTADETISIGPVCSLATFQGLLYAGVTANTGTAGVIQRRAVDGTWATVLTGPNTGKGNGYFYLTTTSTHIYASYYDPITPVGIIARSATGASGAWSDVFTGTTTDRLPYYLQVYDGVIYAFGRGATVIVQTSANGTTWTDRSGQFTTELVPVFGALTT